MDKIYDTLENLGIDTVGEDYIPELPDDVEPPIEAMEEHPRGGDRGPQLPWWTPSASTTRCGCI